MKEEKKEYLTKEECLKKETQKEIEAETSRGWIKFTKLSAFQHGIIVQECSKTEIDPDSGMPLDKMDMNEYRAKVMSFCLKKPRMDEYEVVDMLKAKDTKIITEIMMAINRASGITGIAGVEKQKNLESPEGSSIS